MKHHHELRPGDIDWVCTQEINRRTRLARLRDRAVTAGLYVAAVLCIFASGWVAGQFFAIINKP